MAGHIIDFSPNGEVQAMHNDAFSLAFLGDQDIERASELVFDSVSQKWQLHLPYPDAAGGYYLAPHGENFDSYVKTRKVEVEWMNECRLCGIAPASIGGQALLVAIRQELKL